MNHQSEVVIPTTKLVSSGNAPSIISSTLEVKSDLYSSIDERSYGRVSVLNVVVKVTIMFLIKVVDT